MITYEYKCTTPGCPETFEIQASIKDSPLTYCSKCKKETLEQVIGTCGVIYKGHGFPGNDMKH